MTESEPPSIVRGKCAGWADVEVRVEKSDCTVEAIERFFLGEFGGVARKDAIIDFYSRLNGKRGIVLLMHNNAILGTNGDTCSFSNDRTIRPYAPKRVAY